MIEKFLNRYVLGNRRYQNIFNKFYHYSKYGRNIGLPIEVKTSGEEFIIQKLSSVFNKAEPFVFLDIGANSGEYTALLLKYFNSYKNLQCHLFEPQKALSEQLNSIYQGRSGIVVNQFGLGSKEEKLRLFNFNNINTISSVYSNFKGEMVSDDYTEINIRRLDSYLSEKEIYDVHFMKIDVEGHELEVLRGTGKFLERNLKVIQFEFGSFNIASRTYFQDFWKLLSQHYIIYRILKDGLWEIKNYSIDLEIFDTTNYLAIRRNLNLVF